MYQSFVCRIMAHLRLRPSLDAGQTFSLLKKALSEHFDSAVHLSFGNHPQVIQIQKFVTVFVTIGGRCLY